MSTITIEQTRPEATWKLRRDVMYPDKTMPEMEMPEDADGYHFSAYKDGWQIGVVSLFQEGTDFQFRKFAVAEKEQGKGTGTLLLNYVFDFAITNGAKRIWCNARVSAIGFYHKFGMVETGLPFTKGGIDYIIMEKTF